MAATMPNKKRQSGALLELRTERSQSLCMNPEQHSPPVPKPPHGLLRLQSVPGNVTTASPGCSNGGIPTKQNCPPPKPPRTHVSGSDGGASLGAESLEEEEEEVWEETHYDEDTPHTQVEPYIKEEDEIVEPLLPIRAEGVGSRITRVGSDPTSSSTLTSIRRAEEGNGRGASPKVPLLPIGSSHTTPIPRRPAPTLPVARSTNPKKATPAASKIPLVPKVTSTSSNNAPSILKTEVCTPSYSKSVSVNPQTPPSFYDRKNLLPPSLQRPHSVTGSFETGSKSPQQCPPTSDSDSQLQEENKHLRQQLLLLQNQLQTQPHSDNAAAASGIACQAQSGMDSSFARNGMLSTDDTDWGHEGGVLSPCLEEWESEEAHFPSAVEKPTKPVPQPRTQLLTQTQSTISGKSSDGSTNLSKNRTELEDASRNNMTASPVPKPRSNVLKSCPQQDGESIKVKQKRDAVSGDIDEERSDATSNSTSGKEAEKVKAALTLQKLIPVCQATVGAAVKSSGLNKEPLSKISSTIQSPSTPPASLKPVPLLRSMSASPVDQACISVSAASASNGTQGHELNPPSTVTIETGAAATAMEATSQTRNQVQAPSNLIPHSDSVSSPSHSSPKPDSPIPLTVVKAPLKSASGHVCTFQGRAKYKKVTLDDNSWIKRKASLAESLPEEDNLEEVETKDSAESDSGSNKQPQTVAGNTENTGAATAKPLPYRSHSILPVPKTMSQPFLTPSSPLLEKKLNTVGKVTPTRPPLPVKPESPPPSSNSKTKKKGKEKRDRRRSFTTSVCEVDVEAPSTNEGKGKGKKVSKKPSQVQLVEEPSSKPTPTSKSPPNKFGLGRAGKKAAAENRPVSMMVMDSNPPAQSHLVVHRHSDLTASATVSMPRGMEPDEIFKPQQKKGGLFGRFKSKAATQKVEAPPIHVSGEQQEGSDSGSEDEKGGTIKKMPKLKHVSIDREVPEDDSESHHQLFEYVFVVGLKEDSKKKLCTETTYTFPPFPFPDIDQWEPTKSYKSESFSFVLTDMEGKRRFGYCRRLLTREFSGKDMALKSIPQFCFPDLDQWKPTKSYKSESFSFVLTDMEGKRRFGYCRRLLPEGDGLRLPEVFCIVSPLGCFSLYENILDHVEARRKISSVSVFKFLKAISANPFPRPGRSVEVKVFGARGSGMETLTFTRPMDSRLEHVNFSLLFSTLSRRKIIKLFSSLLMERRVIFCTSSLSLMTGCAHALMALLYPFEWQHVFIPVLPSNLKEFVCSPLPYIIGISPSTYQHLDDLDMEEAVIVNLDKGKFLVQIGDEDSILPSKLFQFLEGKLEASIITSEYSKSSSSRRDSNTSRADELVVNTFMTFFAYLYGDCKDKVKMQKSGHREFQRTSHIKGFSSKSTRRFLEAFQMTQMFDSFIELRETASKAETLAASLFEKRLPELKEMCQQIELFSSKSRFDRWKMKKDLAKGD